MLNLAASLAVLAVSPLAASICYSEPRAAWRGDVEAACLARGEVRSSAYVQQIPALGGRGSCGLRLPVQGRRRPRRQGRHGAGGDHGLPHDGCHRPLDGGARSSPRRSPISAATLSASGRSRPMAAAPGTMCGAPSSRSTLSAMRSTLQASASQMVARSPLPVAGGAARARSRLSSEPCSQAPAGSSTRCSDQARTGSMPTISTSTSFSPMRERPALLQASAIFWRRASGRTARRSRDNRRLAAAPPIPLRQPADDGMQDEGL